MPHCGSPPRAWGQLLIGSVVNPPERFTPTGVGTMSAAERSIPCRSVHPHGRGDNSQAALSYGRGRGSPPRAWGQCFASAFGALDRRFTPTGVGTITLVGARAAARAVHPHGRGDNDLCLAHRARAAGSPPRAWGQSTPRLYDRIAPRFTPTGVGTMSYGVRARCVTAVHPHGRGDNLRWIMRRRCPLGSPPRAWGQ